MESVGIGLLAGVLFGLLTVLVRRGVMRVPDPVAGSVVILGIATALILAATLVLVFGASLNNYTTYNTSIFGKARFIHIDDKPEALGEILRFVRFLADDASVSIDETVAASEQRTGFRNYALANYMKAFGVLTNPVEMTLGVYFHQCAIAMSCRQLAMAARFLAHHGRNPSTGMSVVSAERARRINALMLTCGHYDGSGEFAYLVGLPGKSGVGGGILAIAPGRASICVWSPGLDASGNSHLGRIALEALTKRLGWSIFGA